MGDVTGGRLPEAGRGQPAALSRTVVKRDRPLSRTVVKGAGSTRRPG